MSKFKSFAYIGYHDPSSFYPELWHEADFVIWAGESITSRSIEIQKVPMKVDLFVKGPTIGQWNEILKMDIIPIGLYGCFHCLGTGLSTHMRRCQCCNGDGKETRYTEALAVPPTDLELYLKSLR